MIGALSLTGPQAPRCPGPLALDFQLITKEGALRALAPAWQALLDQAAQPEPMLAPDWLHTWWEVYGPSKGRALRIGLWWHAGELVGIAPLLRRRFWHRPGLPFRRLEFLGADADEPDGVCSDYLNLLVRPGWETAIAQSLAWELKSGGFGSWDELVLAAMDGGGPMPRLLIEALAAFNVAAECTTTAQCPYLALEGSWSDFLKRLPKKRRQGISHALRDFFQWAGSDYQLERARTSGDLVQGLQILEDLHQQRWQGNGLDGAFSRPRFRRFHEIYLPKALTRGLLDLNWLTARGQPIAVHYSLRSSAKVYFYQCGRRLDVPAKIRPGIVMLALTLEEAFQAGEREFDFLAGEALYKAEFTQTMRPLVQVRAARSGPLEWSRRLSEQGIRVARRLRQWTRKG